MEHRRLIIVIVAGMGLGLVGLGSLAWLAFQPAPEWVPRTPVPITLMLPPTMPSEPVSRPTVAPPFAPTYWQVPGSVVPLPDSERLTPDLLILAQNLMTSNTNLVYLNGADQTLRWESLPLETTNAQIWIVPTSRLIYLVDETRLLALDRGSGALVWEGALADTILPTCQDCLQVVDDYLLVLTRNGMLQSIEAQTGIEAWTHRLNDTPRQMLVSAGQVAVLDRFHTGGDNRVALHMFNPADGTLNRRIIPICPDPEEFFAVGFPSMDTPIFFYPDEQAFYILISNIISCAQRIDAVTGEVTWNSTRDGLLPVDLNEHNVLLADEALYVGNGEKIIVFARSNGRYHELMNIKDYDLFPLAADAGMVIVKAVSRRGSEPIAIWGLDAMTGTPRWQHAIQAEERLIAGGGAGGWTGQRVSAGFGLVQQVDSELRVETLNLADGADIHQFTIPLTEPSSLWQESAWEGDMAWLTFQRLYAIDLAAGKVRYVWPGEAEGAR